MVERIEVELEVITSMNPFFDFRILENHSKWKIYAVVEIRNGKGLWINVMKFMMSVTYSTRGSRIETVDDPQLG